MSEMTPTPLPPAATGAPLRRSRRARWLGVTVAGLVVGASAVAIVGAFDDGPEAGNASVPPAETTDTPNPFPRTITVSGIGTATGTPDAATISLGVEVTADTANAALDKANVKAQALIDTLTGLGVEEKDIQTSNVSLWPRYDDNGQLITGYTASNQLTVTLRDLDQAGKILDASAEMVGNEIRFNGISFFIDDTKDLESAARSDAMTDARTRAEDYAKAAGVSVGDVVSISETSYSPPTPYPMYAADMAAAGAESSVPLQVGEQDISTTVTVVYAIA